jgi:cation diffusion facilitator CzcD-associated flavoprotein CzcO
MSSWCDHRDDHTGKGAVRPGVDRDMDVVVIGAGQAGLSAAYFLKRANLDHVVLDADEGPGGAWRSRREAA